MLMQIVSVPDFKGDGQVHSLAEIVSAGGVELPTTPVRTILLRTISNNPASRIGDASVSATQGIPFNADSDLALPFMSGPHYNLVVEWDLSAVYVYADTGDTICIAFLCDGE